MGYTEKHAAEDTDASSSKTSQAWHEARNSAAASGELSERNANKTSDSESGGFLNFLFRLAGFGSKDE